MGVGAGVGLDVPQAVLVVLPEDKTLLFGSANSLTGWRQWGHMTPSVARKTARFLSCLMHVLQNLCPQGLRQPFASSSKQMVHISSSSSSTLVNIISSTVYAAQSAYHLFRTQHCLYLRRTHAVRTSERFHHSIRGRI
jgi:hypothetical protein